jgi:hypothetical protein
VVSTSKLLLACASKFLCLVFSSSCDCANARSNTFDLVCPYLTAKAVEIVLDLVSGKEVLIARGDVALREQICLVLDQFKIYIDLPQGPVI